MTLAALLCLALQSADVRLLTVDNVEHRGTAVALAESDGKLRARLTTSKGEQTFDCDMIVEITLGSRAPEPAPAPGLVRLQLTTGDVLFGTILEPDADATLKVKTDLLGEIAYEFRSVSWFGRTTEAKFWPAEPPADTRLSHVYLAGGDQVPNASVTSITSERVIGKWGDGQKYALKKKLAEVAAVYFMSLGETPDDGKSLVGVLDLEDASRVRGRLRGFGPDGAALTDLYGHEISLRAGAVRSISFRNGRVAYVSDLAPSAVDENANYIRTEAPAPGDLVLPFRADRNARGGGLSIGGQTFRKGIGVHAYSSLTFELGGGYERFMTTIGIDDVAGGLGHCVFEVYADGVRVASETMRGGDGGRDLNLDVSAVTSLRLVVDFGEDGGVGDYGDWAGARLIRKP